MLRMVIFKDQCVKTCLDQTTESGADVSRPCSTSCHPFFSCPPFVLAEKNWTESDIRIVPAYHASSEDHHLAQDPLELNHPKAKTSINEAEGQASGDSIRINRLNKNTVAIV